MKKVLIITAMVLIAVLGVGLLFKDHIIRLAFQPTESTVPAGKETDWSRVETVASYLDTPWSLAFLPNNDLLITERSGTMQRVGQNRDTYRISGVQETSEGGLLGVVLHPDFEKNGYLYLYLTTTDGGRLTNQIDRYKFADDKLSDRRIILAGIPAASNHNGGGIAFGPDGKLYVTTGDAARRTLAQDTESLAGKILRMNDDGSTPDGNPFGNLIWSYGHRNPQGITWDDQGRMWSVEHGPSGEWKGHGKDELNFIEKGANYGWPVIAGSETQQGMRAPVKHSGDNEVWAPSGIAFIEGSLFFAGLRGETLYQAMINSPSNVTLTSHYVAEFGRLRAVAAKGNDLYFTTSNQDGRGEPRPNDDKVLRVRVTSH